MKKVLLIKYGEISLKGRNRHIFESLLMKNIRLATGIDGNRIRHCHGRIYIDLLNKKEITAWSGALKYVFGIVGFVPAVELSFIHDLTTIKLTLVDLFKEINSSSSQTFRIETRRIAKHFPFDSMEVDRILGTFVLEHFPNWKVNLDHPELIFFIEIREEGIFIYMNRDIQPGAGGLPVGMSGRGLLLLSGGIDSPVAGWSLLKRGMCLDAVHFHSFPYTGEKAKEKVIDLAHVLSRWQLRPIKLYIPSLTKIQEIVNQYCPQTLWTVLHRRFMLRITEKIAREQDYQAIITGDNLGQVASQTIQNIAIISQVTTLPILRPLIGFDKQEIIQLAQRIGTYRISSRPYEDCCTIFAPKNPVIKAQESEVLEAERKLDVQSLVNEAMGESLILCHAPV